jgi:phosphoribosyl isomerase A
MTLTLLPAVDVADGQAVRLVQGEAGTETGYGDPMEAALAWQRAGAD